MPPLPARNAPEPSRSGAPASRAAAQAEPMVNVKMMVQTVYSHNGQLRRLWPEQVVRVPVTLAEQWAEYGIAGPAGNAPAHTPEQVAAMQDKQPSMQESVRTDLRIKSLHGDVAAARQLDALGEYVPDAPDEGTPAPMTLTNAGAPASASTGASARNVLGGR